MWKRKTTKLCISLASGSFALMYHISLCSVIWEMHFAVLAALTWACQHSSQESRWNSQTDNSEPTNDDASKIVILSMYFVCCYLTYNSLHDQDHIVQGIIVCIQITLTQVWDPAERHQWVAQRLHHFAPKWLHTSFPCFIITTDGQSLGWRCLHGMVLHKGLVRENQSQHKDATWLETVCNLL